MIDFISKLVCKRFRDAADKIEKGECELNKDDACKILSVIAHEPLTKEEACSYLNLSRSRFDDLVRLGTIPKGRKRRGTSTLYWYKDELDLICR